MQEREHVTDALDRRSDRPAYHQIADLLRADINAGKLEPGSQVPSERTLIAQHGAARGTVRQALAVLRTEGLIEVHFGRGAFVRSGLPTLRVAHDRFARRHREASHGSSPDEAEKPNLTPAVETEYIGPEIVPPQIAEGLGLRKRSKVLVRRHRYWADGRPVAMATSYLPWSIAANTALTDEDTGPGDIYARLEELGHQLAELTEEVAARMPHPEEARALELAVGVPVLRVVRNAITTDGTVVEICDTVRAADRYVLSYGLPVQ